MGDVCHNCGREFERVATHWAYETVGCEPPKLSDHQKEILTGLLMGDGNCNRGPDNKNSGFKCDMINREYLEYLDEQFPFYGQGIRVRRTAEEGATRDRESGFSPDAKTENYHDVYRWYTKRVNVFNEFRSWYLSGEKVFPDGIDLTPTALKHWYAGDGCLRSKYSLGISSCNEVENKEKLHSYFRNAGLPEPNTWNEHERQNGNGTYGSMIWNEEESRDLLDYMGEPLPGFEYKWFPEYR